MKRAIRLQAPVVAGNSNVESFVRKGFTMIELMVVIAIIGILAAVLAGTFSGSTESARASQCQANMRNLAMAAISYATEVGAYPYAGSYIDDDEEKTHCQGWIGMVSGTEANLYETSVDRIKNAYKNGKLWSHLGGSSSSYVCPAHLIYAKQKKQNEPRWSYVMNAYFGWGKRKRTSSAVGFKALERKDKRLLFAELPWLRVTDSEVVKQEGDEFSGEQADTVLQYSGRSVSGDESIGFDHKINKNLFAHVCFADGHVEKFVAPRSGDVVELTSWLCSPNDASGNNIDIRYTGGQYEKVE